MVTCCTDGYCPVVFRLENVHCPKPQAGSAPLMRPKCLAMEALLRFWNSTEYQEAKKLREGHAR